MNLLLSGPPGTGKTEFVKYLGGVLNCKVNVRMGSDLLSKWVGETEQNIKQAFAEAEAYLINHAIVIPFGSNTGGYTASRLNPFEGQFGATGLASCRYKGQHLLEKPMSTDEYYDAYDAWLEQREALAAK